MVDVVSLGVGKPARLPESAEQAITQAEIIFGAPRHFKEVDFLRPQGLQLSYPSPLSELPTMLAAHRDNKLVMLASGDALYFGIGSLLIRTLGQERVRFHPNISSVQSAMHKLGFAWQDAQVVSLHGRPLSSLRRHLRPNTLLAVFTDHNANPVCIAKELVFQGFRDSVLHVCERLGSEQEQIRAFVADDLATDKRTLSPLNLCIITLGKSDRMLSTFPGIADHLFSTGAAAGYGMISKREVRLAILSLMQPQPREVAWDIGAGCGSVSVEWARWNGAGHIHAIESERDRTEHIQINCERFGVTENCHLVTGKAPEACADLPPPDSVFVGGSDGNLEKLLEFAWNSLRPGGKLVASAVTERSETVLGNFYQQHAEPDRGAEWLRIAIEKNLPGAMDGRTLSPVHLIKCCRAE